MKTQPSTDINVNYKKILRMLPGRHIVCLPDSPDFTVVEISDDLLQMTNYERSEIVGKPLFDILPNITTPKSKEDFELKDAVKEVLTTKRSQTYDAYCYEDDSEPERSRKNYWQLTLAPLVNKAGDVEYILQSYLDVTDEVEAEQELEEARQQLKQALDNGLVGTWFVNLRTGMAVADKTIARFYGISANAAARGLPLNTYTNAIHPEDRERIMRHIEKAINKIERFEDIFRIIDTNGEERWIMVRGQVQTDKNGHPSTFPGIIVDITKRRRAEIAFANQQRQFTAMSDSLAILLYTARPDTGLVSYVNKAWFEYTGLELEDKRIPKVGWLRAVHPDDRAKTTKVWRRCIKTGKPYEIEQRLRRHDGKYRWHIGRANPIYDEEGNISLWFGYSIDIDDLRRASTKQARLQHITDALRQQRKELVALNKVKDEFISVASHQLRTPATAVKQYLGMMLEGYVGKLTKNQRAALETAYRSNERQLEIVNDLLRVAQADAGKVVLHKEHTYIRDLLQQVIAEQIEKFKRKNQKLIFSAPSKRTLVDIDISRIRMVFENLIDNANKYTPEGKTISITSKILDKKIVVEVSDEGVGIAPEFKDRLFQKFSRIDNPLSTEAGGTGLGLYWAQKIVDLHKGTLKVESEVGKGTTFTVTLPRI